MYVGMYRCMCVCVCVFICVFRPSLRQGRDPKTAPPPEATCGPNRAEAPAEAAKDGFRESESEAKAFLTSIGRVQGFGVRV